MGSHNGSLRYICIVVFVVGTAIGMGHLLGGIVGGGLLVLVVAMSVAMMLDLVHDLFDKIGLVDWGGTGVVGLFGHDEGGWK